MGSVKATFTMTVNKPVREMVDTHVGKEVRIRWAESKSRLLGVVEIQVWMQVSDQVRDHFREYTDEQR